MSKPDNRCDNAKKIKKTIEDTKRNMELAEEMIHKTSDEKLKKELAAKNQRRAQAIPQMAREMQEEASYQREH
ncbi:MAG: small acid-soluble spore protein Tlp [Clostridiales bacterium]